MKSFALILTLLASTTPAFAVPGDPVALRGTLSWPLALGAEPFAVVRADDGRLYYADLSGVPGRTTGALRAGDRVSVLGVEGSRPHEIAVVAYGPGDTALAMPPVATPAAPTAPAASPPTAPPSDEPRDSRPIERIDGHVQSVSGRTMVMRTGGGQQMTVDISRVFNELQAILKPGEPITVLGVHQGNHRLVAVGFIHAGPAPSALPRQ